MQYLLLRKIMYSVSRERLEAIASVMMRVPGLFIIDYWWEYYFQFTIPCSLDSMDIINAIAIIIVLFVAFMLLLLPLHLVRLMYTHVTSGAFLFSCHLLSEFYVTTEIKKYDETRNGFYQRHAMILAFHGMTAVVVSYLLKGPWDTFSPMLGCYAIPVMAYLADLPVEMLPAIHTFAGSLMVMNVFAYVAHHASDMMDWIEQTFNNISDMMASLGVLSLLTFLWNNVFVPKHFGALWLIEFIVKFFYLYTYHSELEPSEGGELYKLVITTFSSICTSPVTLIATSVSISYMSYLVLCITRTFLYGQLSFYIESPNHSGWTEGLTLLVLALQGGLIRINMPARTGATVLILFIVLSSLLQSMLEVAEPFVLTLSASRNRNIHRHGRALLLCLTLFIFPLYLTRVLSQVFMIDFWMMIVLSNCLLTSVQVLDLLLVHGLFLYDSQRAEPWEKLDDVVYYIRAVTKVCEFFIAVFVVIVGLWESTSRKWDWVDASLLLINGYFNVWQRLQTGWRSFLLRREAVQKSESLPSAAEDQLKQLDDVCSICFSHMSSACITPCHHYFHRACLRKWLYIQDKCPLCFQKISSPNGENAQNGENTLNGEHPHPVRTLRRPGQVLNAQG